MESVPLRTTRRVPISREMIEILGCISCISFCARVCVCTQEVSWHPCMSAKDFHMVPDWIACALVAGFKFLQRASSRSRRHALRVLFRFTAGAATALPCACIVRRCSATQSFAASPPPYPMLRDSHNFCTGGAHAQGPNSIPSYDA